MGGVSGIAGGESDCKVGLWDGCRCILAEVAS